MCIYTCEHYCQSWILVSREVWPRSHHGSPAQSWKVKIMWAAKGEAKAKQKQKQKQSQSTCRHGFDLSTLRGSKKHADIKLNSSNLPLSDSFWKIDGVSRWRGCGRCFCFAFALLLLWCDAYWSSLKLSEALWSSLKLSEALWTLLLLCFCFACAVLVLCFALLWIA